MRWLSFGLVSAWLLAVSIRFGLDQVSHLRDLNRHYVGFSFTPFSNEITLPSYRLATDGVPAAKAHVVEVNGEPFLGVSNYLKTLGGRQRILTAKSWPESIETTRPNCTCGIPSLQEAYVYSFVPTAIVLFGLIVRAFGVTEPRRWIFLALLLCLSEYIPSQRLTNVDWQAVYSGFFTPADVRQWNDAMRLLAVIQKSFFTWSWPAWLVLFLTPRRDRLSVAIAAGFLAYAVLQTVLAVGWSEYYLPFVGLAAALERLHLWIAAAGFLASAAWFFTIRRWAGLVALIVGLVAMSAFVWPAEPPTYSGVEFWFPNVTTSLKPSFEVPWLWQSPRTVTPVYAWTCSILLLVTGRPTCQRIAVYLFASLAGLLALDWIHSAGRQSFFVVMLEGPLGYTIYLAVLVLHYRSPQLSVLLRCPTWNAMGRLLGRSAVAVSGIDPAWA